jgi:hypothetical protein
MQAREVQQELNQQSAYWKGYLECMRSVSGLPPVYTDRVGYTDADGKRTPNEEHPYWKGRALWRWLVENQLLQQESSEWYGAMEGNHPLSLVHPRGLRKYWSWFTGIQDEQDGKPPPSLYNELLPCPPKPVAGGRKT